MSLDFLNMTYINQGTSELIITVFPRYKAGFSDNSPLRRKIEIKNPPLPRASVSMTVILSLKNRC